MEKEPELKVIAGVAYISVGDVVALARQSHAYGASAAQFADAMSSLVRDTIKPVPPPKKKENRRGRTGNKRRS